MMKTYIKEIQAVEVTNENLKDWRRILGPKVYCGEYIVCDNVTGRFKVIREDRWVLEGYKEKGA